MELEPVLAGRGAWRFLVLTGSGAWFFPAPHLSCARPRLLSKLNPSSWLRHITWVWSVPTFAFAFAGVMTRKEIEATFEAEEEFQGL